MESRANPWRRFIIADTINPIHDLDLPRGSPASDECACDARARSLAGMARRGTGRPGETQGAAGALPFRGHDLLAGQPARRQCQE